MFKWVKKAVFFGVIAGLLISFSIVCTTLLSRSSFFAVKTVELRGAKHTDMVKLESVYKELVGKSLFQEIPEAFLLSDDPWVFRLEIKRVLPDKIVVTVIEQSELFRYRYGNKCSSLTHTGIEIPVSCDGVKVHMQSLPLPEEFEGFKEIYKSGLLNGSDITLKNGLFTAYKDGVAVVGTYMPEAFFKNYEVFVNKIMPLYGMLERVDMTVPGKIFVKGVTNG